MDRVHRIGQEHAVTVSRFIVGGSIEEKMLQLQVWNSKYAHGALCNGGLIAERCCSCRCDTGSLESFQVL